MVHPKSKIRVVTVLGIQSTGKSTLLNTMFGVQFAVSSGRCTRGAFLLLIRVNKEYSKEMKCDFLIIIDTEGLKSLELAQLEDSHEHDNELATIVVGLSDITIVNIAMENMTDMKDILQIVVHAFLRMKEVGKKPKCLFVHQNVSDVSAHDNNLRDRTVLLQQLNEMTQAAAKVEKKEENKSFKEVMEYDPDTGNGICTELLDQIVAYPLFLSPFIDGVHPNPSSSPCPPTAQQKKGSHPLSGNNWLTLSRSSVGSWGWSRTAGGRGSVPRIFVRRQRAAEDGVPERRSRAPLQRILVGAPIKVVPDHTPRASADCWRQAAASQPGRKAAPQRGRHWQGPRRRRRRPPEHSGLCVGCWGRRDV
ncbi:unnamed protein product [Boreogadus saida]